MMKKVSKLLLLVAVQASVSLTMYAQSVYDLSGFSTPNNPQSAVRCDQALPGLTYGANGNWLVSTRNANFVGAGASVELANDVTVPNFTLSGTRVVSVDYIGQQVFGEPDGMEARYFNQAPGGGPGTQLRITTSLTKAGGLVTDELPLSFYMTPGAKYWLSCVGVNTPTNNAVARWEWDGHGGNPGDPAYVRYQPAGGWGGAACAYWTPKASCAFLATAGPPNQALRLNICRNAAVVLGGNPVPTMTQWGLFLFGLVLLTLAVVTVYNFSRKNAMAQK